jgi:hypothetical protein
VEDSPARITLAGSDPEGDPLIYRIIDGPSHGELSGTEPNLIYTPNPDFYGQDEFTFITGDGIADSEPARISIRVTAVEDAPTADDMNVSLEEDASLPITLTGSDPEGDPLTYSVVKEPNHGRLSGETPNLIYTPDPNFSGSDSISFIVSDGGAESKPGIVTISVTGTNDPPAAEDDSITTQEDQPATINVLANDREMDDETLKISRVTQGANGSVTINADGTLTYKPKKEFHGDDQFSYTIVDQGGETDTATVKVVVFEVDDPPTITSQPPTTAMMHMPYVYNVVAADPDGSDELIYSLEVQPTGMTINSSTGRIEWTPNEVHNNTSHSVEVKVVNSRDISAVGKQAFSINVTPAPPKNATLAVSNGYESSSKKSLMATGTMGIVQASDDKYQAISGGSYIAYDFADIAIPANATLSSVVVCVEHYEEGSMAPGKVKWAVGTNWPKDPKVWISAKAPTRGGKQRKSVDSWDVTSFVETPEKLHALQIKVENNDIGVQKKTMIDHIYLEVEWDWAAPAPASAPTPVQENSVPDTGLVRYGPGS